METSFKVNAESGPERRVYILGAGSIGKLVAHSLAGIPNRPPITLLVRWKNIAYQWKKEGEKLELRRNGVVEARTGFEIETPSREPGKKRSHDHSSPENDRIDNLILAVKAESAVSALASISHRMGPASSILFLQNGMGFLEEIDATVFPDAKTRPRYIVGVTTHGVFAESNFRVNHAGIGNIVLSLLPTKDFEETPTDRLQWTPSSRYLLRTVTRSPILGAIGVEPVEMRMQQLEKLAINSVINPLTAIYECTNGELLHNPFISRTMNMLIAEISLVIRSLPELKEFPNVENRFKPSRLAARVVGVCETTAGNESSMMVDVKYGRVHEANYLNGYIIRRGEELGINCVVNHAVNSMLKGKSIMINNRLKGYLPLQREVTPPG